MHYHSKTDVIGIKFPSLANVNEEASELSPLKTYKFNLCFWNSDNIAQVISDNLHLSWYEIYLKIRTVHCHHPIEQQDPFLAGCKFLLELLRMIGVSNNKKTFDLPFQWKDGCLPSISLKDT